MARVRAESLAGLAAEAATRGDTTRARRLWGAAQAIEASLGSALTPVEDPVVRRYLEPLLAATDAPSDVLALSLDDAVSVALSEGS
jgi:hypothetical protein